MAVTLVSVVFGLLVAVAVYVRLAPLDPGQWHRPVDVAQNEDRAGGAVRVIDGDAERLATLDAVIRDLPRTEVLAGSLDDGHLTYVTRSAVFGFPDLTTVELRGDEIRMFARLRYGASDLGVNRKRLERVIAALQ